MPKSPLSARIPRSGPPAPEALGLCSVTALHRVLTSPEGCVLCGGFGTFFHALEGERCCWACAPYDTRLWAVSRDSVLHCYHLSPQQLSTLPATYAVGSGLVSARAAVALALQTHGSVATVRRHIKASRHEGWDDPEAVGDSRTAMALGQRGAYEGVPSHELSWRAERYKLQPVRTAPYVRFPYVQRCEMGRRDAKATVYLGLWCPGCRGFTLDTTYDDDPMEPQWRRALYLRQWPSASFAQHVRSCDNVKNMLARHCENKFRKTAGFGEKELAMRASRRLHG